MVQYEKILQGDALEEEETHSEADTSMINQDEDDAPKKTGEMSKSAKANLEKTKKRRSSSDTASQTEAHPKRQKYERLAQDEHDAPKKTGQTAIAGSDKMRVGKEGGVIGDSRKSAKANLETKKRRALVDYGEELVTLRIQVWRPMDKKFYAGTVKAFDPETKKHKVLYDDEEVETLNLRKEKWELLGDDVVRDRATLYLNSLGEGIFDCFTSHTINKYGE